ncbi:MAG TPA: GNAT family N-acetyltransferase [bacterium]|jgi:GNAT superfamily N-acetyltransferase
MARISVQDVTTSNLDDLCWLCVPPTRRTDPAFAEGVAEKRLWAFRMLDRWGSVAKIAYHGGKPAGQIQFRPVSQHRVVSIDCIFVPEISHWRRGIGTVLLASLVEEMRQPQRWFGGESAIALVTKTFPGQKPGQFAAAAFFRAKGFQQVGRDPHLLYLPLSQTRPLLPSTGWQSGEDLLWPSQYTHYVAQEEDRRQAVIIHGPSFCPFSFFLLMQAEAQVREIAPDLPVRWINQSEQPEEAVKRGGYAGCVVNATPITAFVLDRERFRQQVESALAARVAGG